MGGGPDINYPDQPSYGEGMADALKAQVQLLTGTGDFAETGSLESLLPLEESIRKKTAQTDTDVLRQTLLGGGSKETYAPDGKVIGLSKLNRIVEFYARRPQVQENLTMQIHDHVHEECTDNIGVAVMIEANHMLSLIHISEPTRPY